LEKEIGEKEMPEIAEQPKENDLAPDFVLTASNGDEVSLSEFQDRPLVLFFYPKNNAPEDVKLACDFRDHFEEFFKIGVRILGISVETLDSHTKFITKYHIPFLLLCDTDMKASRRYGVFKPRTLDGIKVWGIERTTFVIDEKNKIRKISPNPEPTSHAEDVLRFIRENITPRES
jgi:peroxiredoxin Q/BCP